MKTRYIIAFATAVLMLSGCNRDEFVPEESGNGYLRLEVAGVQPVTAVRGATYNSEAEMLADGVDNFMVQAWNADCSGFVSLQKAKCDDSEWVLEPSVEWNGSDDKTFFAYANLPTSSAAVTHSFTSDDKSQKLEYTLPTDARGQNDIMLGYYSGDGKIDGEEACTAQIQFYHPLTAVKICDGGLFVDAINKVTLSGIYASGTVTVTYPKNIPEYDWGKTRTSFTNATLDKKSDATKIEVNADTKVIGVPFIVIPQKVAAGKVRITLDVTVDGKSRTLGVDVPATTWAAGHTKSYFLSYGSEEKNTLTIDKWEEGVSGNISTVDAETANIDVSQYGD